MTPRAIRHIRRMVRAPLKLAECELQEEYAAARYDALGHSSHGAPSTRYWLRMRRLADMIRRIQMEVLP